MTNPSPRLFIRYSVYVLVLFHNAHASFGNAFPDQAEDCSSQFVVGGCADLARDGMCSFDMRVAQFCAVSCRRCPGAEPIEAETVTVPVGPPVTVSCTNTIENCLELKNLGYCENPDSDVMQTECPEACGFCVQQDDEDLEETCRSGDADFCDMFPVEACTSNVFILKTKMMLVCPQFCGKCPLDQTQLVKIDKLTAFAPMKMLFTTDKIVNFPTSFKIVSDGDWSIRASFKLRLNHNGIISTISAGSTIKRLGSQKSGMVNMSVTIKMNPFPVAATYRLLVYVVPTANPVWAAKTVSSFVENIAVVEPTLSPTTPPLYPTAMPTDQPSISAPTRFPISTPTPTPVPINHTQVATRRPTLTKRAKVPKTMPSKLSPSLPTTVGSSTTNSPTSLQKAQPTKYPVVCKDSRTFRDRLQYRCSAWAGYDCFWFEDSNYTQEALEDVQANCPLSCGMCSSVITQNGNAVPTIQGEDVNFQIITRRLTAAPSVVVATTRKPSETHVADGAETARAAGNDDLIFKTVGCLVGTLVVASIAVIAVHKVRHGQATKSKLKQAHAMDAKLTTLDLVQLPWRATANDLTWEHEPQEPASLWSRTKSRLGNIQETTKSGKSIASIYNRSVSGGSDFVKSGDTLENRATIQDAMHQARVGVVDIIAERRESVASQFTASGMLQPNRDVINQFDIKLRGSEKICDVASPSYNATNPTPHSDNEAIYGVSNDVRYDDQDQTEDIYDNVCTDQ